MLRGARPPSQDGEQSWGGSPAFLHQETRGKQEVLGGDDGGLCLFWWGPHAMGGSDAREVEEQGSFFPHPVAFPSL